MRPGIWKRPNSLGDVEAFKGLGGIVAPLLAGFCLATIAVLLTAGQATQTPYAPWAVTCLSAAAVLFLNNIQFTFLAVRSGSPPSVYLDWSPEATADPTWLLSLRQEQAQDRRLFERFSSVARYLYDVGLVAFLAGLDLLIVPPVWDPPHALALTIVSLAGAFELLWLLGTWFPPLNALMKVIAPVKVDVAKDVAPTLDPVPEDLLRAIDLLHSVSPPDPPPEAGDARI